MRRLGTGSRSLLELALSRHRSHTYSLLPRPAPSLFLPFGVSARRGRPGGALALLCGRAAGGMWRLVPPKLGRLSRSLKLAALGSLLVLMVLHSPSLLASWQRNELTDRRFLQLNKCPACFGTSWCRRFLNGQVVFEAWGRLRLLDFLNVKNVYFAQYGEPREGGRRRVVLKRLGSQRELAQLDQSICKRATGRPRCDLLQAMPRTEFARLNGDVRLLTPEAVEGWSDLVHCPSQRLLDRLVRRYAETKDSGSFLLRNLKDSERMQLLLTLAFNPEPLVLQVGAVSVRGEGGVRAAGDRRAGPSFSSLHPIRLGQAWEGANAGEPSTLYGIAEVSRGGCRVRPSILDAMRRFSDLTADPSTPEGALLLCSQNVSPASFLRSPCLSGFICRPGLSRHSPSTSPWTFLSSFQVFSALP